MLYKILRVPTRNFGAKEFENQKYQWSFVSAVPTPHHS